jgi:predicted amidophosphoribosyltransferase
MKSEQTIERIEEIPNALSAFAKPQRITEEEVSISKEKRICLVCKNKLSKHIYLCSECGAFYCLKCSEALSNLENECWVCSFPFNESKPSKPYEKEESEEKEVVSDETKKKGKKK